MAHSTMLLLNCISIVLVYLQAGTTTATTGQPNWPDGTYALPKPLSGCPDTRDQFTWEEGWIYQETESTDSRSKKNSFSSPLHLAGYFGRYRIGTGYCVKTSITGDSGTQWPNGSYCIAKKEECPEGFGAGSVYWDDEDTNDNNDNFHHGTLPDGDYTYDTKVYYCCRNDTHPSNEIVLPTNEPFFLLRMHQDGCQLVKDTTVLMEFVFWDEERPNDDDLKPPHPYEDARDEGNRLYFCYYYMIGNESTCSDGEIRLKGGDNILEGRVEICFGGVWGTVCDDGWGEEDATVVCRQLGYLEATGVPKTMAHYGQGNGPIFLDSVTCSGTEQHLTHCYQQGFDIRACYHFEDAGVHCQVRASQGLKEQTISENKGNLAICTQVPHNVAATSLKLTTMNGSAIENYDYTVSLKQEVVEPGVHVLCQYYFIVDDTIPEESETFYVNLSQEPDSTGVTASVTILNNDGQGCTGGILLTSGVNETFQLVEFCEAGKWRSLCDNDWTEDDAAVVCREAGYTPLGAVPGTVEGQGGYPEYWEFPVCTGSEMTLNECPKENPQSASCNYTLVQCKAKESIQLIRRECLLVESSTVSMDSLDHNVTLQIVEGVKKECSCAFFASEVNITHSPCGSRNILYTVTVNYTENIASVLNDVVTEVIMRLYEHVGHVNCSMSCSDLVHSSTQSSDSSASSLLPAVLGTLSVLVVIIAASVCVVVILIIVRRKRRKEEPQNLSPAHNINNPIYGGKTLDNDYNDGNKLRAEIQNRESERTLVNPIYGSDSQPSSTMQEISSSVHMYEGIDMGPSETSELNEPQNYEVPTESAQANYEVPIESAQAHYEDIPSGDVDTGDYSTLNTSGQYAILTPAILQPPRGHTTADEDYSLVEYVPPDNDTDEYSQLQHM